MRRIFDFVGCFLVLSLAGLVLIAGSVRLLQMTPEQMNSEDWEKTQPSAFY